MRPITIQKIVQEEVTSWNSGDAQRPKILFH